MLPTTSPLAESVPPRPWTDECPSEPHACEAFARLLEVAAQLARAGRWAAAASLAAVTCHNDWSNERGFRRALKTHAGLTDSDLDGEVAIVRYRGNSRLPFPGRAKGV